MLTTTSPRAGSPIGISFVETVLSIAVLMIASLGLLPLGAIATTTTENQGHVMARATGYAQDKLEQLMALSYGDLLSDTRVFPAAATGGSGLAPGGTSDPAAAVALYVDYLDIDGTLLPSAGVTPPANWYYQRVWQVSEPSPNLKQIAVTATVKSAVGGIGRVPRATVVVLKTFPF
jgi:hypothetical protein